MLLIAGLAGLLLLPTPWNVVAVVVAALGEAGEVMFWLAFLRRYRVSTGAEGLVGERGEVIVPFSGGSGRVRVRGEIWAARHERPLASGERVRVVAVEGLTLDVEPQPWGTEKGPGEGAPYPKGRAANDASHRPVGPSSLMSHIGDSCTYLNTEVRQRCRLTC